MARSEILQEILEAAVTTLGFELVGVDYIAQGHRSVVRVYIDSEVGVTVDDCARVSRQVSAILDVEEPIRSEYTLEVSSPGIERPLFTLAHYQRFIGRAVDIRLRFPHAGGAGSEGYCMRLGIIR